MFIGDCNNIQGDFNSDDFNSDDFHIGNTVSYFYNFFKGILPPYFIENDTYKDANGDGLLNRYLTIFGEEIDEELIPKIECYLNIIDSQISDSKFITHLSDVLGNPPDIFLDDTMYRNLLSYIVSVYKIKGTKKAYELFFSILGFDIELIEIPPGDDVVYYDKLNIYDDGKIYDQKLCQPCSMYDIIFYPHNQRDVNITPNIIQRLRDAIAFNEPINATLRHLIFKATISDTIGVDITEGTTEEVNIVDLYDIGDEYDTSERYDG